MVNNDIPGSLEEKAVKVVDKWFDNWNTKTTRLKTKWRDIRTITWIFKRLNEDEKESKTLFNIAFENIQSVIPRLYVNKPSFQLFPRGDEDVNGVKQSEKLVKYQWDEYKSDNMVKRALGYGLTYGSHVVMLGTDIVKKAKSEKNTKGEYELRSYVARDTEGIKHIPVWDFINNPLEKDIHKDTGIGYKEENVLLSDLEESGLYMNLDQLHTNKDGGDMSPNDNYKYSSVSAKEGITAEKNTSLAVVPLVVHYYGLFEVEEGKPPVEYIISIAGKGGKGGWTLIRFEENFFKNHLGNPYRPFADLHDQEDPERWHSIGEVEQIQGLYAVFNTLARQRLDSITQALRNKIFAEENSVINEEDLYDDSPGRIVYHKKGTERPTPLSLMDVTGGVFNDLQFIRGEINKISGVADFGKVAQGDQDATATAAALNAEAGNMRFGMKASNLNSFINQILRIRVNMNNQFMTTKQKIRIDEEYEEIDPSPVANVDIVIAPGSTQLPNSLQQQQKANALMAIATQFGQVDINTLSPLIKFALVEYLKSLGYFDASKILGIEGEEKAEQKQLDEATERLNQQEASLIDNENEMLEQGESPRVTMSQNTKMHMMAHADFYVRNEDELSPEAKKAIMKHMLTHKKYERPTANPSERENYERRISKEKKGSNIDGGVTDGKSAVQNISIGG